MAISALAARPGLTQFLKFCIVGFSSTLIDFGLLNFLHYGPPSLTIGVAKSIAFLTAVANGFYWNRHWTFRAQGGDPRKQYPKFLLTNTVGLVLNLSIMTGALILATRLHFMQTQRTPAEIIGLIVGGGGKHEFNALVLNGANVVATVVVMAWNFTAAKFFTFKK